MVTRSAVRSTALLSALAPSHGPSAENGCGLAPLESYSMGLHVGALFTLLAATTFSTFVPILTRAGQAHPESGADPNKKNILAEIFFCCRHFGTGIILATAFIHLLFHAFLMFSNECIRSVSRVSRKCPTLAPSH